VLWRCGRRRLEQAGSGRFRVRTAKSSFNDDFNHLVIVIEGHGRANPGSSGSYGHTGVAGQGPGYLNDPAGVRVPRPDRSLLITASADASNRASPGG